MHWFTLASGTTSSTALPGRHDHASSLVWATVSISVSRSSSLSPAAFIVSAPGPRMVAGLVGAPSGPHRRGVTAALGSAMGGRETRRTLPSPERHDRYKRTKARKHTPDVARRIGDETIAPRCWFTSRMQTDGFAYKRDNRGSSNPKWPERRDVRTGGQGERAASLNWRTPDRLRLPTPVL